MKTLERFIKGDAHGIHYAVSIFFATALLWFLVHEMAKRDPVWAISSMVATSDPFMKRAVMLFRARITNTLVGCAVGLLFIAIGGTRLIMLPLATRLIMLALAMAVTVLLSSYVVRVPTMWRQAPISAAFVISAGLEYHSRKHRPHCRCRPHERSAVRLYHRGGCCVDRVRGLATPGTPTCRRTPC